MHTDTIDNLQMIEESAKTFAQQQILPHVMEWDEAQYFPVETMRALGQLGFMGVLVPEEYGGSGLGYHEYVLRHKMVIIGCSMDLKTGSHMVNQAMLP